jgi:very-short-patch-repair endonuclease
MSVNKQADAIVAELALRSDGVFTTRQAKHAGLSTKQIRSRRTRGLWVELYPGVWRLGGTPVTERLRRRAALIFGGGDALLARRTAAQLWGFDGVAERRTEILLPYQRHVDHAGLVVMRTTRLESSDSATLEGFRLTSATRTLIDLAAVLEDETLEGALQSARRMGRVDIESLSARLATLSGPGRAGAGRLRAVLKRVHETPPAESMLEVKVARLLRRAGLPEPKAQLWIEIEGRRFRVDYAWDAARVILECEGKAYHHDFEADRARWSALASAGWRIVFVTWRDVTRNPDTVVQRVRDALAASLTTL